MPGGLPSFRIVVGSQDFTYEAENITFSNVDPGGYEIASFDLQAERANTIMPGDRVRITDGLGVVWEGRCSEPAKAIKHGWRRGRRVGAATTRVNAEGHGSGLKDNDVSFIWIDQDLSRWGSWSIARELALITANNNTQQFNFQILAGTNGLPALAIQSPGQLVGQPWTEVYYDAGPLNTVAEVFIGAATPIGYGATDATNVIHIYDSSDNSATNAQDGTSLAGTGAGVTNFDFVPSFHQRFIGVFHEYAQAVNASAGDTNKVYGWYLSGMALYGPHNLAKRGTLYPQGFYTSDIATHVVTLAQQSGAYLKVGLVDQLNSYIVPHYVQYTPVAHEQVVADMARMAPAHYGVWESSSIFDDIPEFTFRGYNTIPTRFINASECDEVDVSERLADMYTQANISWQDAAGDSNITQVQLPNYILSRAGMQRTFTGDLGLSSSAAASVYGSFILQALFAQSRSGGSVQLPRFIRDGQGVNVPSYRLKSGIDRIRIADLPTRQSSFLSYDTDGYRISRVECNCDSTSGQVQTRIEVDTGPQLVDTLQARMQIASNLGAAI